MALVPGKTVAQMAGESVTQDADLFYFLRGSNDFGITFVDLQTQFMGGITIEAGSQNYLGWNPATSELSMKALAITDVTVDATEISLAAYLAANYTVGDEHQEGDVIYLTAATGGTEAYIHNGGTAVTAADFEIINFPVITSLTGLTDTASASVNDGFLQWNAGGTQVEYVANIGEIYGGTGQNSYATGDMLYASGANTLTKLAAGSNTEVLTLAGGVPTWAAIAATDLESVLTAGNTSGANDINLDKTGTAISAASQVGSQGLHFHSSIWDGVVEVDRKFTMRSLPMIAAFDAEDDSLVWQYEGDNKMTLQVSQTGAQTLYVSDEQRPTDGSSGGFSSIGKGAILASGSVTYIQLQGTGTGAGNLSVDRWDALGGNFSTLNFRTGTTIRMKMSAAGIKIENGLSGGLDPSARLARWHVMGAASGGDQTPLLVQITGAVDALKVDTLAKTIFTVPTTGTASINLPHGIEPTVPVNGDIWTTTAGTFARVNGVTVNLTDTGVVSGDGIYDGSGAIPVGTTTITMAANDLHFSAADGFTKFTKTGGDFILDLENTNNHTKVAYQQGNQGNLAITQWFNGSAAWGAARMAGNLWTRAYERDKFALYTSGAAGDAGIDIAAKNAAGVINFHVGGGTGTLAISTERMIIANTSIYNKVRTQIGLGAVDTTVMAHIIGQVSGATKPLRVDTDAVDNALLVKADSGVQMGGAPTVAGKFTMQGNNGSGCLVINTDSTSSSVRGIRVFDSAISEVFTADSAGSGFVRNNWVVGKSDLSTTGQLRVYSSSLSGGVYLIQANTPAGARFRLSATGEFSMFGRVQIGDQTTTLAASGGLGIKAIGGASPTARALRIQNSVGLELFNVSTTGNVGIGVLSPTERFEIASGTAKFAASTAAAGSIIIPHGVHVSNTFQDGEVWTTTLGMFARINGVTVDLTDTGVASGDGIYDGSGALSGDVVVTMGNNDLQFNSTGLSNVMNINGTNGDVHFLADKILFDGSTSRLTFSTTPATFGSSTGADSSVLRVKNDANLNTVFSSATLANGFNAVFLETNANYIGTSNAGLGASGLTIGNEGGHAAIMRVYDSSDNQIFQVDNTGDVNIFGGFGQLGVGAFASDAIQAHIAGQATGATIPLRVDTSAVDNALTVKSNSGVQMGGTPSAGAGKFTMTGSVSNNSLVINSENASSSTAPLVCYSLTNQVFRVGSSGTVDMNGTLNVGKNDNTTNGQLHIFANSAGSTDILTVKNSVLTTVLNVEAGGSTQITGKVQVGGQDSGYLASNGGIGIKSTASVSNSVRVLRMQSNVAGELFAVTTTGKVGIQKLLPTETLEIGTGQVKLAVGTSSKAALMLPPSVAVTSSPLDGEVWLTTTGMFARINGVTKDLTDTGGVDSGNLFDTNLTMSANRLQTINNGQILEFKNSDVTPVDLFSIQASAGVNNSVVRVDNSSFRMNTTVGNATFVLKPTASLNLAMVIDNLTDQRMFTVNSSQGSVVVGETAVTNMTFGVGNVGIPQAKMHVKATGTGVRLNPLRIDTASIDQAMYMNSAGNTGFGLAGDSDAKVGIKGTSTASSGRALRIFDSADTIISDIRNNGSHQFGAGTLVTTNVVHIIGQLAGAVTPLRVDTDAIDNALLVNSLGRVNVNNTIGGGTLHVVGISGAPSFRVDAPTGGATNLIKVGVNENIGFGGDAGANYRLHVEDTKAQSGLLVTDTGSSRAIIGYDANGGRLWMYNGVGTLDLAYHDDKLGIGVTTLSNPANILAKLHVRGDSGSTAFKVDADTNANAINVESNGTVRMDQLPTSAPATAGSLWNNSGVINIV